MRAFCTALGVTSENIARMLLGAPSQPEAKLDKSKAFRTIMSSTGHCEGMYYYFFLILGLSQRETQRTCDCGET